MSRILLTWELGLNLGHLTRLLPVAQRLKADGHSVLVAARDLQAATTVLGTAGIPFVQAPHLPKGIALPHRATGYADILLSQGWSDRSALWGLTQGWLNLIRMFNPDQLVLDYSPTVSLAARIAAIPCVLVGNGFELPPVTDPLPPFPGFSWATPERAAAAERLAVANANAVLSAHRGRAIQALRDLVLDQTRLFATYPELDHYGERADALYIGPLLGQLNVPAARWPDWGGPKIFACLRPDTSHVKLILSALAATKARVICVASGFVPSQLGPFKGANLQYSFGPVDLGSVLDANLCITYGAEGTMMRFIAAGVPQLISPWHVETYMAARRLESSGVGITVPTSPQECSLLELIERHAADDSFRDRARGFSQRASTIRGRGAVTAVLGALQPATPIGQKFELRVPRGAPRAQEPVTA